MRKPDRKEVAIVIAPVFIAEAVVIVALFVGASVVIRGHVLWAFILGMIE
jgi:hypothetical protein